MKRAKQRWERRKGRATTSSVTERKHQCPSGRHWPGKTCNGISANQPASAKFWEDHIGEDQCAAQSAVPNCKKNWSHGAFSAEIAPTNPSYLSSHRPGSPYRGSAGRSVGTGASASQEQAPVSKQQTQCGGSRDRSGTNTSTGSTWPLFPG
jgi:hypothetical protein